MSVRGMRFYNLSDDNGRHATNGTAESAYRV